METVSSTFLTTVARPHVAVVEMDVWFDRQVVFEGLQVVDGWVTFDRRAEAFARLDCTLAEPLNVPSAAGDILSPYGYELHVKRGVRYPDGTTELVSLGVFPIQSSMADGVSLTTTVSAIDRSQLVRDARFEDDYSVAASTNYATAIQELVEDGVSDLEYLFASTSHTTPLLTFAAQEDRWQAGVKMAASIGCRLQFDGLGRLVLTPEPDLSTTPPTITIAEGEGGVLVGAAIDLDRSTAYNRWIHSSVNASLAAQYRGVATDDDPSSPTQYGGPFGKKPKFFESEFYASNAQCAAGAAADKARSIGVARGVSALVVPNPALRPGDVIVITREALGLSSEVHVIETLTCPLGPEDPMEFTSRSRQDIS